MFLRVRDEDRLTFFLVQGLDAMYGSNKVVRILVVIIIYIFLYEILYTIGEVIIN